MSTDLAAGHRRTRVSNRRGASHRPIGRSRGRPRPVRGDRREGGFVTAEFAAALPAVVAVLALGMWAVATVGVKVRTIDAANSAAIAAARGEDPQAVAAAYLPDGSTVEVSTDGTVARAVVTAPTRPLGPLTSPVDISAVAAAPLEPGLDR
ncbi:TadE family type IV pilus minor pilin [Glycomyces sp. NPDC046736]|uniref:TadE family type IV pilus minor pilin n=1 Tax=Glycomyces sp. NPDC046736 TaxID=3155615 RepID=UPI0033EB641E